MRTRFWITLGILMVLLIVTLAGDVRAQGRTGWGCLSRPGDYADWTITVTPGYFYSVWIGTGENVDLDLYLSNGFSSTGPGAWESILFYAYWRVYTARVVFVRDFRVNKGSVCYTIGVF